MAKADRVADGNGDWRSHTYLHNDRLAETGGWPDWLQPPHPPVDLGPCPVCGQATKRCSTWQMHEETATDYACVWCRADLVVFHTGPVGHAPVPTRPYYAPPDMRWDMCRDLARNGEPRRYHASGHWGLTLCGLTAADLAELGPQWRPDHPDVCTRCQSAAAEIDTRWPADQRTGGTFLMRCPCPTCRGASTADTR